MRNERGRGRGRLAVSAVFLAGGIGMGGWAANIPLIKRGLQLSDLPLGMALLAFAIGAVLIMPAVPRMVAAVGMRLVLLVAGLSFAVTLGTCAYAANLPLLAAWLFALGLSFGALDVAINTEAASLEAAYGRPLMSSFHGLFSIGQLLGAGVSAVLLSGNPDARPTLAAVAFLIAASAVTGIVLGAETLSPRPERRGSTEQGPIAPVVQTIGILAFLSFFAEGAVLDWATVFLVETLKAAENMAAIAFGVFAGAMAIGRMLGDRIVRRFGHGATLRGSGVAAVFGLATLLLSQSLGLAIVGLAVCGLGFANMVPVLFAAAARAQPSDPGIAVARAAMMGYAGLLAGPALIGFVAHLTSLTFTLFLVSAVIVPIAAAGRLLRLAARQRGPA